MVVLATTEKTNKQQKEKKVKQKKKNVQQQKKKSNKQPKQKKSQTTNEKKKFLLLFFFVFFLRTFTPRFASLDPDLPYKNTPKNSHPQRLLPNRFFFLFCLCATKNCSDHVFHLVVVGGVGGACVCW